MDRKEIRMPNRDAVSTIRGYYYQFDYSILKLLELENNTDKICIEGIEDVDLNDGNNITLHQCKCYEGTTYNHSVIAPAVRWMIKHYSEQKESNYKYYIYGVFHDGQNKLGEITVDFVKKHFLTYTEKGANHILHEELLLSDDDILGFINKLVININAESFEDQEKNIRNKLCEIFDCNKQNVELYYCNALLVIKQLSTSRNIDDRTITRMDFLQKIKDVDNQFERWLLYKQGKEKYAKAVRKQYFTKSNVSPYARFFLLQCDARTSLVDLKTIVLEISRKYSKLSKYSKPKYCPYFFFYGLSDDNILKLKKSLDKDNVVFNDGFNYKGADFNILSFVADPVLPNPVQLKIIDRIDHIDVIFTALRQTIEIYQFYNNAVYYENCDYKHVKIPFENIIDIVDMI